MTKWMIKTKKADFKAVAEQFGVSMVTARLLCNRSLTEPEKIQEYLYPSREHLHSPFFMKGMDSACELLINAIEKKTKIRIIGDYDVDGVVSTYILYDYLLSCGAKADYRIPERVKDGYGISSTMVEDAASDEVELLITCDNGISAWEQVDLAYRLGMKVIVTDHHEIPEHLPKAEILLNPKLTDCGYPYRELCGSGVALKLAEALEFWRKGKKNEETDKIDEKEETEKKEETEEITGLKPALGVLDRYLGLAALATVCDVVELTGENRCIVKLGLQQLKNMRNIGLNALFQVNRINMEQLGSYHLGYVIGPCINASGRLDTALQSMELLLEKDSKMAQMRAGKLQKLNDERKQMTADAVAEAEEKILKNENGSNTVFVLLLDQCHESIAGIVAGRIREKYGKPTIILTYGLNYVKGSARSVEQYNITEELTKCKELLISFGGHKMAAGLSLKEENVSLLRERLNESSTLTNEILEQKIVIDMVLPIPYMTERLYKELDLLEPFGTGNSRPIFAERELSVTEARYIGKTKKYLKFKVKNTDGAGCDALYFGDSETMIEELKKEFGTEEIEHMFQRKTNQVRFSVTYDMDLNSYEGNQSMQMIIRDYRISPKES